MKPEHPLVDLALNCVLPALILARGTEFLGAGPSLAAALSCPLLHAGWSLAASARPSPLLPLALIGTGLTGGLAWFELPASLYAVKEAALPVAVAAWLVVTANSTTAGLRGLVNRAIDLDAAQAALSEDRRGAWGMLWKRGALRLAAVTAMSGFASAALAVTLVHSPGGSEAFNAELSQYTAWSWPTVNLPGMLLSGFVMWRTVTSAEALAGAPLRERS